MNAPAKQSRGTIKGRPWHGTVEDLKRLVDLFLALQAESKEKLSAIHAEKRKNEIREHERLLDGAAEYFEKDLKPGTRELLAHYLKNGETEYFNMIDRMAIEAMDPVMTVTYKELDTRDSGEPNDVLGRINIKQVRKVQLNCGRSADLSGSGIFITLDDDGAEAIVTGDEMFVNGAINRLKEIFRQQRPSVSWMRSRWFLVPFPWLVTVGILQSIISWLYPENDSDVRWYIQIASLSIFAGLWFGIRWLVPPFQLVPLGKRSRSDAALAVLGALAIGVAASVIYGVIT